MAHIAVLGYDLEEGGISRVAELLANGFAERGHAVTLLICTDTGARDAAIRQQLHKNVTYVALSGQRGRFRGLDQLRLVARAADWIRRDQPDIVLGTANNISWFSGWAAKESGVPVKLFVKTTNPILRAKDGRLITALRRFGYRRLFRFADAVLTLSDQESAELRNAFGDPDIRFVTVANPYIGPEHMKTFTARTSRAGDALSFLFLGRLEPQKNVPRLLKAFARALQFAGQQGEGFSLRIAGNGRMRDKCEKLAHALRIADKVRFLGFCSDSASLLAQADALLLPSNYEGLPAVVPEALAAGCPVISTDCFLAARELLTGLPGCAVVEQDDEELARAIAQFVPPADRSELARAAHRYSYATAVEEHLKAMGL